MARRPPKRAIIVGCNGQDGRFLYDLLLREHYQVLGIHKTGIQCAEPGWAQPFDICNPQAVFDLVDDYRPREIYYLAAVHHASQEIKGDPFDLLQKSFQIHVSSLSHFLEGIRRFSKKTRLFYAASSHIFGDVKASPQDENTPIAPHCIYGLTKACGLWTCRFYRGTYGLFASVGILYNHESGLRPPQFVSTKIIQTAINIQNKKQRRLVLGDVNAPVDWGYAPDYVDAMHRILELERPDDFIVATGQTHTVLDFVKEAFGCVGLDWKRYVREDSKILHKKRVALVGNPKKLITFTGWKPSVTFKQMVQQLMAEASQTRHSH